MLTTAITESKKEVSDFPKYLKHYTTLDKLISILSKMELHLGGIDKWEDKNDAASVRAYASHRAVTVKVLCFAYGDETVHHWNTFAQGPTGCRIDFNNDLFEEKIKNINGLVFGEMKYLKRPFDLSQYNVDDYPFMKRFPYECENEFRIIWAEKGNPPPIPIKGLIKRITLSPHVNGNAVDAIRELLDKNYGIKEVCMSQILDFKEWTNLFDKRT